MATSDSGGCKVSSCLLAPVTQTKTHNRARNMIVIPKMKASFGQVEGKQDLIG